MNPDIQKALHEVVREFESFPNREGLKTRIFNCLQEAIWAEDKDIQMDVIEEIRKRGLSAKGQTWALCSAAYMNNLEIIHQLVALGADVNESDSSHWQEFPLASAAEMCHIEAVKLLLEYGADATKENSWALWAACDSTETEFMPAEKVPPVAKLLLEAGADANAPWCKNTHYSLIRQALSDECEETVLLLLKHGARIRNTDGSSISKWCYGMPNVMIALIELGMRGDDIVQGDNMTFLMEAAWNKDYETVKTLLELGANINAKDDNGMTALDYARQEQAEDIVELLTSYQESHK